MIGDLFDSPWKILIVAAVIIVLFGSKKLPSAARSLGQSMRILKKEVQGLHEDEPESRPPAAQPAAEILGGAPGDRTAQQAQFDALQQQISDLQRATPADAAPQAPVTATSEASRPARQPV
jgi:sec-independent protein translocase protein TatA